MSTAIEAPPAEDLGLLVANGMRVQSLQTALSRSDLNVQTIPKLILSLDTSNAWQAFSFPDSPRDIHRWNAAAFRDFLRAERPAGCGTPLDLVERLVRDTPAEPVYWKLTRGQQGNPTDSRSESGRFSPIRNNVTDWREAKNLDPQIPDPIPSEPPPLIRDYTRESKQGNSVSYAIRRLERNRPDLLEKVKAGDLSPHAAMVVAGFRPKLVTIPAEPAAFARAARRHFTPDQIAELIAGLVNPPPAGSPSPESPSHA